ncbi:MAG: hypothetical protein HKO02_13205 [Hyphomonadaceae bacterium]|nr:hypothetical protein [Hyphomonadaceae bacterium]
MNKNNKTLLIIGLLVIAVGVGFMMSQKSNEPDLSIKVDESGIEIDGK